MIIFQHDHAREIMTMGINPSNQHAIFFNQSKSYQLGSKTEQVSFMKTYQGLSFAFLL